MKNVPTYWYPINKMIKYADARTGEVHGKKTRWLPFVTVIRFLQKLRGTDDNWIDCCGNFVVIETDFGEIPRVQLLYSEHGELNHISLYVNFVCEVKHTLSH